MKKLIFAAVFIATTIVVSGIFSYRVLDENALKAEELNFMGSRGWQWHDEAARLQIKRVDGQLPALRKVAGNKHYASLVTMSEDGEYRGFVFFDTDCEEGSIITNTRSQQWDLTHSQNADVPSDLQVLHCLHGKLVSMKTWRTPPSEVWEGKIGEFQFRVEFNNWDFTELQRAYLKSTAELI